MQDCGSHTVDYEDLVFWDTQLWTNSRNLLSPGSALEAAGITSQNNS